MQCFGLSEELSQLYIIDDMPDIAREIEDDDETDGEEGENEYAGSHKSFRTYAENAEKTMEKYQKKFEIPTSGVYMDEDEQSMKIEYDVFYEEMFPEDFDRISHENYAEEPEYQTEFDFPPLDGVENYSKNPDMTENALRENASYRKDIMSIEYEKPELVGGQKTYQRLVFKADFDGESVYELSLRKLQEAGIDVSAEYDGEFESMIFTSVNNKYEGEGGNFNEFYLNGDIGGNAVDKELLKAGDVVEWRYAEETDGSCGGVPDYNQIKSLLEYSAVVKGGMPLSFNPNNMYAAAA